MDDTNREQLLAASWQTNAAAWSDVVRKGQIESRRVATDAALLNLIISLAPRRVLDVGCGEGWLSRRLATSGIEVVGVDGSASLIATAQAAGGSLFRVLSYNDIVADPATLDGPYDMIVCNFSLLGAQLEPLLHALRGALAIDGALVIQTLHPWTASNGAPYYDGWRTETFDAFGTAFASPMPWYFRTVSSWIALLRRTGLVLADLDEPTHPQLGRPLSLLLVAQRILEGQR